MKNKMEDYMKKYILNIVIMSLFLFLCIGCGKEDSLDVEGNKKPIENNQGEQSAHIINSGVNDNSEGEIVYQEPYAVVSEISSRINLYVEDGEVKKMEFSKYSGEMIPQEKYSNFGVEWAYVNGELYLGKGEGWYYTHKISNCEDKVLLEASNLEGGLDYGDVPQFRVFDINTKEIISIYPDYIEEEYYISDVWISSDLSNVVFFDGGTVFYYDGTQVSIIEQFENRLENVRDSEITMADGKILVLGYGSARQEIYCFVYDIVRDEFKEYKYTSSYVMEDGLYTYELFSNDFRYGRCYTDGYLTIVDLLTGREDKTEIPKEKTRWVENISEDCFFVLADYGYFIEKATGRIVAKTEYEIAPSKEGVIFDVKLIPSDEDIYFYLRMYSSEEGEIYKIDLND